MRKKVYVEVPEQPDVEMFLLLDRAGIIYINLSCACTGKGVILIVPAATDPKQKTLA